MLFLPACLCLLGLVTLSEAYSNGPPINTIPALCTDLTPSAAAAPLGHAATTQIGTSPFEVVINQNCYKAGLQIQVAVRTITSSNAKIKGLFVQARQVGGSAIPLGSFDIGTDTVLSTLTCTGAVANSAVGHNKVQEAYFRSMMWTSPASFTGNIRFSATVVQDKGTFWVALKSPVVTYSSSCVASAQIGNTRGSASGTTHLQATPIYLTLALVSILMAIFAQ